MSKNLIYKQKLELLAQEAIESLGELNHPIIQFCGPISTGGFGNVSENIEYLSSFIQEAKKQELSIFDQLIYEKRLDKILKQHNDYDYPLLIFFYKPILSSGIIDGLVFLPLWETSIGSKWEYDFALTTNIPQYCLKSMLINEIINFYDKLKNKNPGQ